MEGSSDEGNNRGVRYLLWSDWSNTCRVEPAEEWEDVTTLDL